MKYVRIIPAIPKENKKLRVAAYCRVSTSGPEQMRSLEIQIKTYSKMIKNHSNWIFAGVFYDIESGLRRSGRKSLDKLLRKAANGKIDYIITKSISRVSRDTLETPTLLLWMKDGCRILWLRLSARMEFMMKALSEMKLIRFRFLTPLF